jgi:RimJ/RimL family protein N-acetyltransferase
MEYGIQRRGIYLAPPTEAEVEWFCEQFESREVWEMFGLDGPSKLTLLRHYRSGDLVVGILHRVEPRKRIGFVVMFPPDPSRDFWEFGYAIGDPLDRDAFSAMSSTDAMAHYMFEHLHVEAMGWRTRSDNHAASAVIRRLGYTPRETRDDKSYQYTIYRLDRDGWFRRRAKLDRGEATHPSGIGDTFVTLPTFPYEPIPVPKTMTGDDHLGATTAAAPESPEREASSASAAEPAADKKPAHAKKPATAKKAVTAKKPATDKKPAAAKKSATDKKSATAKKAATAKKSATAKKPATDKRAATAKKSATPQTRGRPR